MEGYKRYLNTGDQDIPRSTLHRYGLIQEHDAENLDRIAENPEVQPVPPPTELVEVDENVNENQPCEPVDNNVQIGIDVQINIPEVEYRNNVYDNNFDDILLDDILPEVLINRNHSTFEKLLNEEDFFRSIALSVNKSKAEILLMVLKYAIHNSLSFTALVNLLKLINALFPNQVLPDTRYSIDQIFNDTDYVEFHAVCHNCCNYIGKFEDVNRIVICDVCSTEMELNCSSNNSYFVVINPSQQIANLLTIHENYYQEVISRNFEEPVTYLKDIYDGNAYRQFVQNLPAENRYKFVTGIFNTDGAPKFKCSKYGIWPIYLMINEIPPQERMNNIITCGLWFHKNKPNMSSFLHPFLDVMDNLSNIGFQCNILGEQQQMKLFINVCCVDSAARAPIQGIKQYNGFYGCNWCLHPGEYADGSVRYPLLMEIPQNRDCISTINLMLQANPQNPMYGIKYPSPLINAKYFNIIDGFVPDYLHCCLEGVALQFTDYYLESKSNNEVDELDKLLNNICVPIQISRLTRPLKCRNDWKAREWENFILYYSEVIFSLILNQTLLKHWSLFVRSLYILLKSSISITELNEADKMLHEFVAKSEHYFGKKAMTYNVHQLTHISRSVLNWGPLWTHSTFPFESENYLLLKAIKCAKGVTHQIVRLVNINHHVKILQERVYSIADPVVKLFCEDIIIEKSKTLFKISNNISYFGREKSVNNPILHSVGPPETSKKMFHKMVKDGCLYESISRLKKRSNNCYAQLRNMQLIRIIGFIVDCDLHREYTACQIIHTENSSDVYKTLKKVTFVENEIAIIPTEDINGICVFIDITDFQDSFISVVPNLLHY